MKTHGYDITQARLHRKTLCYSRVRGNAEALNQIVATLPQVLGGADSSMIHGIIQQRPRSLVSSCGLIGRSPRFSLVRAC